MLSTRPEKLEFLKKRLVLNKTRFMKGVMNETAILERYEIPEVVDPDKLVARQVLQLAKEKLGYDHPDMVHESGGGPLQFHFIQPSPEMAGASFFIVLCYE